MSSIMAYVLDKDDYYHYERVGDVESVLLAIDIEKANYTLQPPPTQDKKWRWVNNEWIADEAAE